MVTVYTISYNEELMMEFFVNHYRKRFPNCRIVVYDNESTDDTVAIAKKYIGLDQCEGKNVDIVSSSHDIPLQDNSIDIIVSSSCFEHDPMFWITFNEMCRLLKLGGLIYINAPSNGPYHAHPVDNWRFYADSWKSLEQWARHCGYNISLLESYIDSNKSACGNWNDSVGIFTKE